ncbi:conserved hypothetical protein [Candidatus Desulfarcum epimagneticum]|uniref:Fibronectin type-III domain-containing protein n=1 Tax=uncultured Desulfobacteraceae bacterium TaxID=218296 RepID=A0A484HFN0_9BACT|nr:conserved hypothetical protein [uncultured Desulfobacteraceae bacterium]
MPMGENQKIRLLFLTIFITILFFVGCLSTGASQAMKSESVALESVTSNIPARHKTGKWPVYPNKPTAPKVTMILKGEPVVTMIDDWKVRITFETAVPTQAATVFYGVYDPDALFVWPRFPAFVKEKESGKTSHSVELDLGALKKAKSDIADLAARGGGVIAYRLELYNIGAPRLMETVAARLYDRRFEFYNGKLFPTVTEGPFVDVITKNSVIISWDTDRPAKGVVKIEGMGNFPTSGGKKDHFEMKLENLKPGATYNYSVEVSDRGDSTRTRQYYFKTPEENLTKFNFSALGDSREGYGGGEYGYNGVNCTVMRALATDAFNRDAEFIIHTGDMVNGYSSDPLDFQMQLESYKDSVENVKHFIPTYEMMGNHEIVVRAYMGIKGAPYGILMMDKEGDESGEAIFRQEMVNPENGPDPDNEAANVPPGKSLPPYKESVYYFDYGNCRFVMMNNNYWYSGMPEEYGGNVEGYILDDQMKWILDVFAKTKSDHSIKHLFIYAQEPFFPVGGQHTTGMWHQGGDPAKNNGHDRRYIPERRDQIWNAFIDTGKALLAQFGDEHNYSRSLITKDRNGAPYKQKIWQIVSGGAGAPFAKRHTGMPWDDDVKKTTAQYHHCLYKVRGDKVYLEVYNIDNMLIDSLELTKDARK